jgi:hypothetical protein
MIAGLMPRCRALGSTLGSVGFCGFVDESGRFRFVSALIDEWIYYLARLVLLGLVAFGDRERDPNLYHGTVPNCWS